jgi:hypothetical protein
MRPETSTEALSILNHLTLERGLAQAVDVNSMESSRIVSVWKPEKNLMLPSSHVTIHLIGTDATDEHNRECFSVAELQLALACC